MPEQQADYDTDTDDPQPTPGQWRAEWFGGNLIVDALREEDTTMIAIVQQREECEANGDLIAAAGTAASELPEGCDPVGAVEELPRLLDALQTIARADGTRYAGTDALQHVAEKVLDAIRTDTSETDD